MQCLSGLGLGVGVITSSASLVVDGGFNSPDSCGDGDDMCATPRSVASVGMTDAGGAAMEGGYIDDNSGGGSVGAMASIGGGGDGSSSITDGCDSGSSCALVLNDMMSTMISIL
jgi:hypothetical protein